MLVAHDTSISVVVVAAKIKKKKQFKFGSKLMPNFIPFWDEWKTYWFFQKVYCSTTRRLTARTNCKHDRAKDRNEMSSYFFLNCSERKDIRGLLNSWIFSFDVIFRIKSFTLASIPFRRRPRFRWFKW